MTPDTDPLTALLAASAGLTLEWPEGVALTRHGVVHVTANAGVDFPDMDVKDMGLALYGPIALVLAERAVEDALWECGFRVRRNRLDGAWYVDEYRDGWGWASVPSESPTRAAALIAACEWTKGAK